MMNNRTNEVVVKNRKSRSDPLYGIYREDDAVSGWRVVVNRVFTTFNESLQRATRTQGLAFPERFFADDEYAPPTRWNEFTDKDYKDKLKKLSLAAAKQYRDEKLEENGMKPVLDVKVSLREFSALEPAKVEKKRHDSSMYGISRDERTLADGSKSGGWKVRIKNMSKTFMDSMNGGYHGSLFAAKEYRDNALLITNTKNPYSDPDSYLQKCPLRLIRDKYDINYAVAAKWMGISPATYQTMERIEGKAPQAFIDLFTCYAEKTLNPDEVLPQADPRGIRDEFKKTQTEMSFLVTGKHCQSPWSNWEVARNKMPKWVWAYLCKIAKNNLH